jgi:type II secretory pathway pseudopilin PulG
MKRQRMNNNGFTLIETTVAMLVMMVVGLGATSLFLYAVRYNSGASQRSIAMAVAQQRLEVLRGTDYSAAALSFGTHDPETIVIAPTTTTGTYTPSSSVGADQSYDAPVVASSYSGAVNPNANPNAQAMPTPTPASGEIPVASAGSSFYRIQTQVDPFPIGTPAANATQKRITIRVAPINGSGSSSWVNQSPIEVVFHRSLNVPGPYKQ